MRHIKWNKSHDVFFPAVDEEHKHIFQAVGELHEALECAAPLFQVQEILHRLIASVEDHFAHEERMMREGKYESFKWHKQQHDTVRKHMREFIPLVEEGDTLAGIEMVEFLCSWLRDHTGLTDRMMSAFLRNQQRSRVS